MTKKESKENIYKKNVEKMSAQGYSQKDFVIPKMKVVALGGILAIFLMVMVLGIFRFAYGKQPDFVLSYPIFIIMVILSVIVHEMLHGLGWIIGGKCSLSDIMFGISSLFPYCNCSKPLFQRQYLVGLLFPVIVLGGGSFGLALMTANLWFVFSAAINFALASGDIIIAFSLKQVKSVKILDHPIEAGFVAFILEKSN